MFFVVSASRVRVRHGEGLVRLGKKVYIHFALLFVVQSIYAWVYVRSPWLRDATVVPLLFRLVVWTLPSCLAPLAMGKNPIDYLGLRMGAGRGVGWGLVIGVAIVLSNALIVYCLQGRWQMNSGFGWNLWVNGVLLVGLSEEVLFRGYFFRTLAEQLAAWKANAIQAALFLGIHLPGWLMMNQLHFPGALRQCAYVFLIALVMGFMVKKTGSLWSGILIHSLSNFSSFAFRL
jgi:uncharacterized protein